jgi:hypothetical protein
MLGFDANNKKLFLCNPELPKDLSSSNAITEKWMFGSIPLKTECGDYAPYRR